MTILYQIINIPNGYAIADANGNQIPETASYGDLDWARVDLIKMAADYFYKAKEDSELSSQEMNFNNLEVVDNKVILK